MAATQPVEMGNPMLMLCAPPPPQLSATAAPTPAPAQSAAPRTKKVLHPRILEHLTYKNLLQQYTKRRCIPLPIYKTINEGSQGALQFRATILVDGGSYTSLITSSDREAAEWNAAKLALEGISQKIKDEGRRLICENKVPCKSTLDAFAVKMNLEMPTYNTINQMQKRLTPFISSLVFNGVSYIGEAGRNKGQAEVLAARVVIFSLLGSSDLGTLLFEMTKHDVEFQPALLRKAKFYAALYTVKDTCYCQMSVVSQGRSIGQISAIPQGVYVGQPLGEGPSSTKKRRKNKKKSNKKLRYDPQLAVGVYVGQPLGEGPSSTKKRRKNKKKSNKKLRSDTRSAVVVPMTQAPPTYIDIPDTPPYINIPDTPEQQS